MRKAYQNYIFDLYGTLVDIHTDEDSPQLWASFALYLGLSGLPAKADSLRESYIRLCKKAQAAKKDMLSAQRKKGPFEMDILSVWKELGREAGVHLSEQQATEISRVFRMLSLRRLSLFPGTKEVLRLLRNKGKKVILLSNAQASFTRPELHLLGLDTEFDAIFLSSEAGVKKPSPAFFDLLWEFGLEPKESIMIGNDDLCDCRGASQAGMDSIYIKTEQSPTPDILLSGNCKQIAALSGLLDDIV